MTSANNGGGFSNQFFTIAAPVNGTVSFHWSYQTFDVDGSSFDPFGYVLNGVFHQLTTNGTPQNSTQSGDVSFAVNQGDVFGFDQQATDSILGSGVTTISNFDAPVPEPTTLAIFGMIGIGSIGYAALRRRKLAKA
jgi:hypothetical protein